MKIAEVLTETALDARFPVFHGTSMSAWTEIQATDQMRAKKWGRAVCFTQSVRVAEEFARIAARRDDDDEGVVISFNAAALLADHQVVPFRDRKVGSSWSIRDEKEVRIAGRMLSGVSRYVKSHYTVSAESFDDPMEWGGVEL